MKIGNTFAIQSEFVRGTQLLTTTFTVAAMTAADAIASQDSLFTVASGKIETITDPDMLSAFTGSVPDIGDSPLRIVSLKRLEVKADQIGIVEEVTP